MSEVVCHFDNGINGFYRTTIKKLISEDTQLSIQKKYPELFDNKTVYFVSAIELPILYEKNTNYSYVDGGGITFEEYTDKTEAIEAARILAKELSIKSSNCFCITVIQGISNCRKRYDSVAKNRRGRDVYTISTKSIGETLLARRHHYLNPITVDEYIRQELNIHQDTKRNKLNDDECLYNLIDAITDARHCVLEVRQISGHDVARNEAINIIMDWAENNQSHKYSYEKFEYVYTYDEPDLIEAYSKQDKVRITIMISKNRC